jgi:hypothetical protein
MDSLLACVNTDVKPVHVNLVSCKHVSQYLHIEAQSVADLHVLLESQVQGRWAHVLERFRR